jgi:YkoY family integral membrane protein
MELLSGFGDYILNYFSNVPAQWHEFYTEFPRFIPIIGMLIIIESLLSVDNAAVLATMVMELPKEQRNRALKYGIMGAYIFRGICLVLAAFLTTIWWLEAVGGIYLLYLVYDHFKNKDKASEEEEIDVKKSWFYNITRGLFGQFWATVILVELMDLAFSVDNVLAAAAYTPNIIAIWLGVFIGILGMRFIAQWFVKLMGKFPFLETSAFVVIGVLGFKLGILSLYRHFWPEHSFSQFLSSHTAEIGTSIITLLIFVVPIITALLFDYPKHSKGVQNVLDLD